MMRRHDNATFASRGGNAVTDMVPTRREALRRLTSAAALPFIAMTTPACARDAPDTAKDSDDALLERLLSAASPHIPTRNTPYRVTRGIHLARGTSVTLAPGVRLLWAGPTGSLTSLVGVFVATGDDVAIVAQGEGATVECAVPSPFVYAALMRGLSGFTVTGLHARECQHVHVNASTEDYASVRLDGSDANGARNVHINGGGASYAKPQPAGHGACFLHFARSCSVRNARYFNVPNGLQWWGGNADPVRPPANGGAQNERKCRDIVIENVVAEQVAGAAIWGAMGSDIVVRDCAIAEVGDVGFDAEGCNRVTFERCTARNARNGCYSTFFLCNGIRFVDCVGIVDKRTYPLMRVYNESQTNNDNLGLEIIGGTFECRDPEGPSTIDTANGPVGTLLLTRATLRNVRVDLAHSNMHRTTITHNTLEFTRPLGELAAISAGSSKSLQRAPTVIPGGVVIEGNVIHFAAATTIDNAAVAILLREDDFNSSAVDRVRDNRISGPFATGIAIVNASVNTAVVPRFTLTGNSFKALAPGARVLSVRAEAATTMRPVVEWDSKQTRDGRPVALSAALR